MLKEWYSRQNSSQPHQAIANKYYPSAQGKFDAIVVGGGPAGACAAYFMAREGMDVLLLERGSYPGAKVCGGSSIAAEPIHSLFPNFWDELDYERLITAQSYWLMTEDSAVELGFRSTRLGSAPFNRFSVRRVNLYNWLIRKAKNQGVSVLFDHHVSKVLFDGQQAVGVQVSPPQDTIFIADVVVLADGANSLLGEKAGLRPKVSPDDVSLYAKETIALPGNVIEERFNLPAGHGAIIGLIGYPTAGFNSTASIHTYKASINLNVGISVSDMAKSGISPYELLDRIKSHEYIKPIIAGGVTTEYGAALIPEGGYNAIPELVHQGLMIIGDAASLVNGVRGFGLAMWSGYFAAQAASKAKKKRDFSQKSLSLYPTLLEESFVMQDLKANAPQAKWMRHTPYFFDLYARMVNESAFHISKVYNMPKKAKRYFIFKKVTSLQPLGKILRDAWGLIKVVR